MEIKCDRCGSLHPKYAMGKLWDKLICPNCRKFYSYFDNSSPFVRNSSADLEAEFFFAEGEIDSEEFFYDSAVPEDDMENGILPDDISSIMSAKRLLRGRKFSSNQFLDHTVRCADLKNIYSVMKGKTARQISDIASLIDFFSDED